MTLLDETLTAAADLGRAAATQATGVAAIAGRGISEVAHQGQAVLDDLGGTDTGSTRNTGRIMALAVIAAIAGLVIWRRRSDRGRSEDHDGAAGTTPHTEPGAWATPELAMSPNVDAAARTEATR